MLGSGAIKLNLEGSECCRAQKRIHIAAKEGIGKQGVFNILPSVLTGIVARTSM